MTIPSPSLLVLLLLLIDTVCSIWSVLIDNWSWLKGDIYSFQSDDYCNNSLAS